MQNACLWVILRDWKGYNEALVKRGLILLDLDFVTGWPRELKAKNEDKEEARYRYPESFKTACYSARVRLARKLENPRLLQITFHTSRHWEATVEYAKTRDILHIMKLLGHKNIKNTLIYTQLIEFKDDEYTCKAATTSEEAKQLIEAGFEYICTAVGDIMLFRKRK